MCWSFYRVIEFRFYGILLYLVNNNLKKKRIDVLCIWVLSVEYKILSEFVIRYNGFFVCF